MQIKGQSHRRDLAPATGADLVMRTRNQMKRNEMKFNSIQAEGMPNARGYEAVNGGLKPRRIQQPRNLLTLDWWL
jgi:hypothetical protein